MEFNQIDKEISYSIFNGLSTLCILELSVWWNKKIQIKNKFGYFCSGTKSSTEETESELDKVEKR